MPLRRVTHGDSRSLTERPPLPLTCAAAGPPRGHLLCKQGSRTSSPLASLRTFAPAASTTPAASIPATRAFGLVSPTPISHATSGSPRRMCQSAGVERGGVHPDQHVIGPRPRARRCRPAAAPPAGRTCPGRSPSPGPAPSPSRRAVVIDTRPHAVPRRASSQHGPWPGTVAAGRRPGRTGVAAQPSMWSSPREP
jgi:hypothetical protein